MPVARSSSWKRLAAWLGPGSTTRRLRFHLLIVLRGAGRWLRGECGIDQLNKNGLLCSQLKELRFLIMGIKIPAVFPAGKRFAR